MQYKYNAINKYLHIDTQYTMDIQVKARLFRNNTPIHLTKLYVDILTVSLTVNLFHKWNTNTRTQNNTNTLVVLPGHFRT